MLPSPLTIIGSGAVAQTLAKGLAAKGATVTIATRDPAKLASFGREAGVRVATTAQALVGARLVILAVQGLAAEAVVREHAAALAGLVVLDATNPIATEPPVDGVLRFFTKSGESLMERLQTIAPAAHFVKAFNSVGHAFMVDPAFPGGRPTMFIAGNHDEAKRTASALIHALGWEAEDVGRARSAEPLESLCQLWCAPGFLRNQWTHAFKLLKA